MKHFRTKFTDDLNTDEGLASRVDFSNSPSMTIKEAVEDTDINILMKRMGVTKGAPLPYFTNANAIYGDVSEFPTDPTELANIMREGQLNFLRLPAELRKRYETPEALWAFMNDDTNYEEAVKLGLLEPKQTPPKDKLDTLIDRLDQVVSSGTSSDKGSLVPPSQPSKEK